MVKATGGERGRKGPGTDRGEMGNDLKERNRRVTSAVSCQSNILLSILFSTTCLLLLSCLIDLPVGVSD